MLHIVVFVIIIIDDIVIAIWYACRDVAEFTHVDRVAQQVIPWDALNRLLGNGFLLADFVNDSLVGKGELVVLAVIAALRHEILSIRKFDGIEEVWKVLVDVEFIGRNDEAPGLHPRFATAPHEDDVE